MSCGTGLTAGFTILFVRDIWGGMVSAEEEEEEEEELRL
jgi:hypothetical protein